MLNSNKCTAGSGGYEIKLRIIRIRIYGLSSVRLSVKRVFQMQNRRVERRGAKSRRVGNGKLFGECANCASLEFSLQAHVRRESAGHGVTPILSTTFKTHHFQSKFDASRWSQVNIEYSPHTDTYINCPSNNFLL